MNPASNSFIKMKKMPVFLWGLGISVLIGCIDLIYTIIRYQPDDFKSLGITLAFIIIPAIIFSMVYFIIWFLVCIPISRLLNILNFRLLMMYSIFYGTTILLIIITDSLRIGSFSTSQLIKISLCLAGALVAALVFFFITKKIQSREQLSRLGNIIISSTVFCSFEVLIIVWFISYYAPPGIIWMLFFIICALFLAVLTIIFLHKKKPRLSPTIMLNALLLVVFSLGIIHLLSLDIALGDDLIIEQPQKLQKNHPVPSILLLTIDTLRPDFLSCYNSQARPTRNIDQLAEDGILFRNAISPSPWTAPSITSLMTGLPCMVHSVDNRNIQVPDTLITIAEVMKECGYLTGSAVFNALLTNSSGFAQGFHYYRFFPKFPHGYCITSKILGKLFPEKYIFQVNSKTLTDIAVKWFNNHANEDFFFWLHILDPHLPYSPPRRYLNTKNKPPSLGYTFDSLHEIRDSSLVLDQAEKKWVQQLYEAEVRYVDIQIGRVIKTLKSSGIYEETLIVLLSDHGEEFWEHGGFEHGHTLYNELLHVPLIIKLPQSLTRTVVNKQVDPILSTKAVMPTILDLCDIDTSFHHPYTQSLSQYWTRSAFRNKDQTVFSSSMLYGPEKASVIFDEHKFITSLEKENQELYNLNRDPRELRSLIGIHPSLVEQGTDKIIRFQIKTKKEQMVLGLGKAKKVTLDQETKKRLRALGYIK
ncbi:MAG: sulfatase [bacterium]